MNNSEMIVNNNSNKNNQFMNYSMVDLNINNKEQTTIK